MKLILVFLTFVSVSVSVFAANPISWICGPKINVVDAGYYIKLSDASSFPYAEVSEMTIAGTKVIYKDYLYKVGDDNNIQEYRDLYSNGRNLILTINTSQQSENGFPGVLKLDGRTLGQLGILECKTIK